MARIIVTASDHALPFLQGKREADAAEITRQRYEEERRQSQPRFDEINKYLEMGNNIVNSPAIGAALSGLGKLGSAANETFTDAAIAAHAQAGQDALQQAAQQVASNAGEQTPDERADAFVKSALASPAVGHYSTPLQRAAQVTPPPNATTPTTPNRVVQQAYGKGGLDKYHAAIDSSGESLRGTSAPLAEPLEPGLQSKLRLAPTESLIAAYKNALATNGNPAWIEAVKRELVARAATGTQTGPASKYVKGGMQPDASSANMIVPTAANPNRDQATTVPYGSRPAMGATIQDNAVPVGTPNRGPVTATLSARGPIPVNITAEQAKFIADAPTDKLIEAYKVLRESGNRPDVMKAMGDEIRTRSANPSKGNTINTRTGPASYFERMGGLEQPQQPGQTPPVAAPQQTPPITPRPGFTSASLGDVNAGAGEGRGGEVGPGGAVVGQPASNQAPQAAPQAQPYKDANGVWQLPQRPGKITMEELHARALMAKTPEDKAAVMRDAQEVDIAPRHLGDILTGAHRQAFAEALYKEMGGASKRTLTQQATDEIKYDEAVKGEKDRLRKLAAEADKADIVAKGAERKARVDQALKDGQLTLVQAQAAKEKIDQETEQRFRDNQDALMRAQASAAGKPSVVVYGAGAQQRDAAAEQRAQRQEQRAASLRSMEQNRQVIADSAGVIKGTESRLDLLAKAKAKLDSEAPVPQSTVGVRDPSGINKANAAAEAKYQERKDKLDEEIGKAQQLHDDAIAKKAASEEALKEQSRLLGENKAPGYNPPSRAKPKVKPKATPAATPPKSNTGF